MKHYPKNLLAGVLALLLGVPVAFAVYYINGVWAEEPEKAVKIVGLIFVFLAVLPPAVYLLKNGRAARLDRLGLSVTGAVSVLLAACYFFQAGYYVFFPADVFIWSESDFVNDILKFRQSYPIFTAEVNNESFTYVPGTQLLTYFLARLAGHPESVSAFRAMQVLYTVLSAIVAFLCCRRLVKSILPDGSKTADSPVWGVVWLTGLFLVATNALTNPFNHLLHNDALAQLVTVTAFWLLLEYEASGDKRILWLMALIPAAGFWVKQSLIIWALFYAAYLLIFARPRSLKTVLWFAAVCFGSVFFSVAAGYWLWQENFIYWVFTVLGAHGVSPLRSFRHLLNVWTYPAVGLIGGAIVLLTGELKRFLGIWLIWLALIFTEIYTSGVAWMLNHIGPGCLIAGVWFWAGFTVLADKYSGATIKNANAAEWLRASVAVAVVCLLFSGLAVVRIPVRPFDYADAERYIGEIEKEFAGQPADRVLLDLGTWVYLKDGVIMKDRAPSIGERGYSKTGDFSGVLQRLEQKYYSKIIVRNLHSPDFWYDHEIWDTSSRIRETLLKNYVEVGRIAPVKGLAPADMPYGFNEASVLVPRAN